MQESSGHFPPAIQDCKFGRQDLVNENVKGDDDKTAAGSTVVFPELWPFLLFRVNTQFDSPFSRRKIQSILAQISPVPPH